MNKPYDYGSDELSIDLGNDHYLRYHCWAPDRDLNPQYADLPDVERYGATVWHKKADGQWCISGITFDTPTARRLEPEDHMWQVQSWEPLTISPSLLCRVCGDHGFIRNGKWERA